MQLPGVADTLVTRVFEHESRNSDPSIAIAGHRD